MNYIIHLNKTFEKFCEDERLTPFHVSLYFSLFQYWNMARFRNPLSISRDEVMRSSKIGSVNTYIRCIKELDQWQYIKYTPSYNPQKGSQVHLYNFNNSNNNGSDISTDKGFDKTGKKANSKAGETRVIPSINNTNKLNSANNVNGSKPALKKITIKKSVQDGKAKQKKEKSSGKKEKGSKDGNIRSLLGRVSEGRPTSKNVAAYFTKKQWLAVEGQKFFNHYESNGWLVGGKTPMRNWQASARNWMLNAEKFATGKVKPGKLNATTEKNYSEPL
jgi:hypothetical protein